MSDVFTSAMTEQFGANVYQLAQQKGSRLRGLVSMQELTGTKRYFERVGATTARKKTGIHQDSPHIETPWDRRAMTPVDYDWGELLGTDFEKAKMIVDPMNPNVQAGGFALGRSIDDEIIAAATGTVYTGATGTTPVVLPETQKVAVTLGAPSGFTNAGLNLAKLIAARSLFGKADIDLDDPANELYMAVTQQQLDDLLAVTEVKSSDYNIVKALADGTVKRFMGFTFVPTQRLVKNTSTDIRTCFGWVKSGIAVALPIDIKKSVNQRPDKCNEWYAYAELSVAAARMEETKVVEIACDESPA